MNDATKGINPKNKPYQRRVRAENQPLVKVLGAVPIHGTLFLTRGVVKDAVGTKVMGPNRKDRRAMARAQAQTDRWIRTRRGKKAMLKRTLAALGASLTKRYTMRPGAPVGPKKSFWKTIGEFFYDLLWFLATPIRKLRLNRIPKSKRGIR